MLSNTSLDQNPDAGLTAEAAGFKKEKEKKETLLKQTWWADFFFFEKNVGTTDS